MVKEIDASAIPVLPGYELSKRLGAGGYGEVWLAKAPGGLTKAVKFIYGSYHEKRAEHEFRSLERVKEVRHPFLLSLERIEIVDNRLAIVTELADGSLKERFDQCRSEGMPGIPRDELLRYLHDAADALDYLYQKHSLQHLDVKPENLLLVAGHVKVADFGLVKDVGVSQGSLVGGLTPLYSAPEVFQGTPTNRSDQYSLAVLFQELLTGVLPFDGSTAAELTLQHLHDEPNLTPLPLGDRYVLARALAKDPQQRFESCSAMVAGLSAAGSGPAADWSNSSTSDSDSFYAEPRQDSGRAGAMTMVEEEAGPSSRSCTSNSMFFETPTMRPAPPRRLPDWSAANEPFRPQPALVVGVGGLAAQVLRRLRQNISKQFGEQPLPSVKMLLIDSDPKTAALAQQGPARTALRTEETLVLPLKRPQDYRAHAERLSRWLSRRWLYNIPRSLRTEGIRPLGRLALVDHARQATQRMRMALSEARAQDSLAETSQRTGYEFQSDSLRVIVVSSITGGTGSGMSLDVGFLLRESLAKLDVRNPQLIGVFIQSVHGDSRQCDLARVNGFSWLSEFNHYHRPGAEYPGDESCHLSPLPGGQGAFDAAYLATCEDGASASCEDSDVQSLADYIFLDVLTPAQRFFDDCRHEPKSESHSHAPLRTLAVRRAATVSDELLDAAAALLARSVVARWYQLDDHPQDPSQDLRAASREPSIRETDPLVAGAVQLVAKLQLKADDLASHARQLMEAQFGLDAQSCLREQFENLERSGRTPSFGELVGAVERFFQSPSEFQQGAYVLGRPIQDVVAPLSRKLCGDVARWALGRLDNPQLRLAGARQATTWLAEHLDRVQEDAERLIAVLARQTASLVEGAQREARALDRNVELRFERALSYFRLRLDQHAVAAASAVVHRILGELKELHATLAEMGRHLKHLAAGMPAPLADKATSPAWNRALPSLVDAVDEQIQTSFLAEHGGLFQSVLGHSRTRAQLFGSLSQLARQAIDEFVLQSGSPVIATESANNAGQFMAELLSSGGDYRTLAVNPHSKASSESLPNQAPPPGTLACQVLDSFECVEGWNLPLPLLAADLIQSRRDYADFAERVHSRQDLAWTPLLECAMDPAPPDFLVELSSVGLESEPVL
jgi:serine/threonine protein kinase